MIESELPAGRVQPVLPDTEPGQAAGQIVSRVRLTNVSVRSLADAGRAAGDVGYLSAHGTATPFNDLMESKALALVFGAAVPPVNSIKSALGHTLGAAAALEALASVRTLETGLVPPTAGLATLDPEIALDVVRDSPRAVRPRVVLSTASGFGGTNAAVVLSAA